MLNLEKKINSHFLKWYYQNKRELPWRKSFKYNLPNPYYIFVSEYMLQQTTVNTVKERFIEFINKWPSLEKLSRATEPEILKFWSGLGYYSRARYLLKAAKLIKKNYNNNIPKTYDELIALPGIGDYTAKAILGIAYNKPVMPTDANIERIIVRLFAINKPISKIKDKLKSIANNFVSKKYSSNLIQAFMDYGSIICVPRNPKCDVCIINSLCESHKKNLQSLLPLKLKKISKKPIKYTRAYVLINEKDEILVRKRPSRGMLASMLEIPNDTWVESKKHLSYDKVIKSLKNKLKRKGSFEYSFSHFDLQAEIFFTNIKKSEISKGNWLKKTQYSKSALPTVMKKIVQIAV